MNFIKDKATGILYRPILPKDYKRVAELNDYTNSGEISLYSNEYGTASVSYTLAYVDGWEYNKKKSNEIKNNWVKINGLWGDKFLDGNNKLWGFLTEVNVSSIDNSALLNKKQKIKILNQVTEYYLEPKFKWSKNVDSETKEIWNDLVKEI
jgi:hypothetical protein